MKIPLQQTQWHGIDLVRLAADIGHDFRKLPDGRFFEAFYNKLFANGQKLELSQSFVENKRELAHKFGQLLDKCSTRDASILSVGVGPGVAEAYLINDGWKVDLQECQKTSIEYFIHAYKNLLYQARIYYSEDMTDIDSEKYHVVICSIMSHHLSLDIVEKVLASVRRILKPDGVFIWCDIPLTWHELYQYSKFYIYNHLYRVPYERNGIFWGWKRSISVWHNLAKQNGFDLLEQVYLDSKTREFINPPHYFGTAFGKNIAEQITVYKKARPWPAKGLDK
ncbi:MAG: class I SAM-dependent methyltransferase [Holosporales bacterium]|jgi:2-polyprenyl-3-methyl-5-hydroxy-6-metoxy-1,4-benzoquinol methylase|nr:class I SAM-dependent methyltransferase [Holosporales bacterium]